MAATVLLRRRAVAPLTATLVVAGVTLYPSVAHAEAPDAREARKPIYDDPSQDTLAGSTLQNTTSSPSPPSSSSSSSLLFPTATSEDSTHRPRGPTPTDRLAAQIRTARVFLYRQTSRAEDAVNRTMDRAFHLERSFTSTLASLAPPRDSGERLMPGLIYVLVAAMAGSIATRRSNILLRAAVPLALGVGAANVVLPITSGNVGRLVWQYEERFPAVADAHRRTREGVESGVHFAKVHSQLGVRYVNEKIGQAREAAEGWAKKGK